MTEPKEVIEVGEYWKCDFCGHERHESYAPKYVPDEFGAPPLMACLTCFMKVGHEGSAA